jgi:hypothetical protein
MKKHFLLFTSFAVSALAMAQNKPSVGIRAGITSSTLKGDAVNSLNSIVDFTGGAVTSGSRTGFFAGGTVRIPVNEMFSVEPSVLYAQKGYELNGSLNLKNTEFLGANAKARLTSHYIDFPVVLKANIKGFQVFAGPQISYLAKADLRTTAGALGFNVVNTTTDATNQFNRWDAGLTGGIGYQFGNGVNINAAYDHGLSRVNSGKSLEAYNRGFKVGVGIQF